MKCGDDTFRRADQGYDLRHNPNQRYLTIPEEFSHPDLRTAGGELLAFQALKLPRPPELLYPLELPEKQAKLARLLIVGRMPSPGVQGHLH